MFWKKQITTAGLNEDVPLSQKLNDTPFIVFDTETTGFQVAGADRIIEIAAVPMKGSTVFEKETFQTYVNPDRPLPDKIIALTGITEANVADAPPPAAALSNFFQFTEDHQACCLVGHYVSFDLMVLKHTLLREKITFKKPTAIDTLDFIGYLAPSWDMRDLERYAMAFGTRIYERHSALGDSLTTAYLFAELLRQFQDRGYSTWGDLRHATSGGQAL